MNPGYPRRIRTFVQGTTRRQFESRSNSPRSHLLDDDTPYLTRQETQEPPPPTGDPGHGPIRAEDQSSYICGSGDPSLTSSLPLRIRLGSNEEIRGLKTVVCSEPFTGWEEVVTSRLSVSPLYLPVSITLREMRGFFVNGNF